MKGVSLVCKPVGLTPLEGMQLFLRQRSNTPRPSRTSYAGRLDPMADGLLMILEGEQCDQQEAFQNHDKDYCWEMILGLSSDTYDVLGLANRTIELVDAEACVAKACHILTNEIVGRKLQAYPPYSSVRIKGHPLFWWAQQNRLAEVDIPVIEVSVRSCHVGAVRWVSANWLLQTVLDRVSKVIGTGFRQRETCARWQELLGNCNARFPVISVRSSVSSGTYIRSLAHEIGQKIGCGALALGISRVSIGTELNVLHSWHVVPMDRDLFDAVMHLLQARGYI